MAKFDLKTDLKTATKPLYAGVGATDLVVERVRDLVSEAQKRGQKRFADAQKGLTDAQKAVQDIDLEPKALRDQATAQVNARVDAIAKDAKARRVAIEKRVAELQAEANEAYGDLVTRGEGLVTRIRRQESTTATTTAAKTTATKAKTTKTQATKATKSTASTAKKSTKSTAATTKKTAAKKSAPAKSSAKATGTAAKKTAASAVQAAGDAAAKVGD